MTLIHRLKIFHETTENSCFKSIFTITSPVFFGLKRVWFAINDLWVQSKGCHSALVLNDDVFLISFGIRSKRNWNTRKKLSYPDCKKATWVWQFNFYIWLKMTQRYQLSVNFTLIKIKVNWATHHASHRYTWSKIANILIDPITVQMQWQHDSQYIQAKICLVRENCLV